MILEANPVEIMTVPIFFQGKEGEIIHDHEHSDTYVALETQSFPYFRSQALERHRWQDSYDSLRAFLQTFFKRAWACQSR